MAWVGPAITAGGALGGAALGGKAAGKAAKAQERSTDKALAFEREREASRKANYDRAMAQYEQQWNAWNSGRNALLGRYGASVPMSPGQPVTGGVRAGGPIPGQVPQAPQQQVRMPGGWQPAQGGTIRSMVAPGPQELSAWNDWSQHGIA